VLAVGLRDSFELWGAARATARFSKLALPAIVVLALSGTVQAWRQTGTWASLWQTTYGHLLVAKLIVVCALVVAAYASRDVLRLRLVPALRVALGPGAARREAEPDDARELRNGVWVEAGLAIVILAITAALVNSQPAREAAAATPRTVTANLSAPPMRFGVAAQPALPGNNTIVVAPQLTRGSPPLLQVNARIWLPGKVAPIPLAFAPLTNGRYAANVLIPFSGNWKLEVTGLRTATDESAAVTAIRFG
jgi:copper transport protein